MDWACGDAPLCREYAEASPGQRRFFFMQKELFRLTLRSRRQKYLFDICEQQNDYFSYNDILEKLINFSKKLDRGQGLKTEGRPSLCRNFIFFFVKIGYLEGHPAKGLRVNKDFIPLSQK